MTRSEDPPGAIKHLRFGKISPEAYEALSQYPGIKAIVLHTHGKKGEHPHWHVWWEGTKPITNQTIRNQLKKLTPFKDYSGQNDWSFRNHDNFTAWADYVVKNPTHQILMDYRDLSTRPKEIPTILTLGDGGPEAAPDSHVTNKSSKRLRYDERICMDAASRLLWKRDNEFSLAAFEDHTCNVIRRVEAQVFSFMRGRINNNEAVKYARNLLYEFADDDLKEYLERKVWEKISWI